MTPKIVTVLVVDDDVVDVAAIRRSFADLHIGNPIVHAKNGIEALEQLRGENGRAKVAAPTVVLLDLNMPLMDGIEFLDELRADPKLRRTVTFVLTTSAAEVDRREAYARCISGYVLKHQPGESFLESVAMFAHYWRVIEFPA